MGNGVPCVLHGAGVFGNGAEGERVGVLLLGVRVGLRVVGAMEGMNEEGDAVG